MPSVAGGAQAVGMGDRHYQRVENDEGLPGLEIFSALADHFGVSLSLIHICPQLEAYSRALERVLEIQGPADHLLFQHPLQGPSVRTPLRSTTEAAFPPASPSRSAAPCPAGPLTWTMPT